MLLRFPCGGFVRCNGLFGGSSLRNFIVIGNKAPVAEPGIHEGVVHREVPPIIGPKVGSFPLKDPPTVLFAQPIQAVAEEHRLRLGEDPALRVSWSIAVFPDLSIRRYEKTAEHLPPRFWQLGQLKCQRLLNCLLNLRHVRRTPCRSAANPPHERFVDVTPMSLRRGRPLQRLVGRRTQVILAQSFSTT